MIEINASPDRRDLNENHARAGGRGGRAHPRELDAHSTANFELLKYGIATARRAWLSAEQAANTRRGRVRPAPQARPLGPVRDRADGRQRRPRLGVLVPAGRPPRRRSADDRGAACGSKNCSMEPPSSSRSYDSIVAGRPCGSRASTTSIPSTPAGDLQQGAAYRRRRQGARGTDRSRSAAARARTASGSRSPGRRPRPRTPASRAGPRARGGRSRTATPSPPPRRARGTARSSKAAANVSARRSTATSGANVRRAKKASMPSAWRS